MIWNFKQVVRLSKEYDIPVTDILLISLNFYGLTSSVDNKRLRFKIKLDSLPRESFYLAVCINTTYSPFSLINNQIFLNDFKIGIAVDIENDSCDSSYFRRNNTAYNINTNSRSNCSGCKFCGTYNQEANDSDALIIDKDFHRYMSKSLNDDERLKLKEIAICTGCFPKEENLVDHLLMIHRYCQNVNISPNIKYIGSQIGSPESFQKIADNMQSFSYYSTIECFERRKDLLRYSKANISFDELINRMDLAVLKSFSTTFLYILGLDSLSSIKNNFHILKSHINCFPVINIMQSFTSEQDTLRHEQANDIEYYLKARKIFEDIFRSSNMRPLLWENYRGLWYTKFGKESLRGEKI